MLTIESTGKILGATIRGADLSKPLDTDQVVQIATAIVKFGVVCISGQKLSAIQLRDFAMQLGALQIPEGIKEPDVEHISVLSNIVENGRNIGALDAGMIWHKDMTYQREAGWVTVLYGITIPRRDGHPLGATRFANALAAYNDLSDQRKADLQDGIGVHNSIMYNAKVRAAGSTRAAYSEEKIKKKQPLPHPVVMTHPMSGRPILYCDPGHVERIDGLHSGDSDEMIAYLAAHQLQEKYQYAHEWTEGDVLMWDNLSTLHTATLDYRSDEHRLMKRCQIVTPHEFCRSQVRQQFEATPLNA